MNLKGLRYPVMKQQRYFGGDSQESLISLKPRGTLCGFYLQGTIHELWIRITKTWQSLGFCHHNLLRTPFPSVSVITYKAKSVEKDCTYVVETVLLGKEDTLHILLFRYHV